MINSSQLKTWMFINKFCSIGDHLLCRQFDEYYIFI